MFHDKNDIIKYFKVMKPEEYDEYEDLILSGKSETYLTKDRIVDFENRLKPIEEKNKLLFETSERNNLGISLEKTGLVYDAIEVYEENVKDNYPATHSYDRLIILYVKLKNYNNASRVLQKYIKVFSNQNEERFNKALSNPKNRKYIDKIKDAHETNTGIKNDEGWYIYSPYPLMKYIEKLEKLKYK